MSSTSADVDVLVIGAGPVGLTVANECVRGGASVRIIEKLPAIREISKALIWHVRTQEALDKIGVLERGIAEAQPLKEVVMRAYGKRIGSWSFPGIESPNPHALIIGQNRTQHLLLDLLRERGHDVDYNTEAIALDASAGGDVVPVTVRANGAESVVNARYVVGCEGSDSLVRKSLGLSFSGERYTGEQFIQADCKIAWTLPAGRSYLFLTDDGYMMVIEMPGGAVRIFISLPDKDGAGAAAAAAALGAVEDMHAAPTLDDIHANFVRLTGIEARLSDATWLARYRTSHRYANTFGIGRCFVAGDAGHVHVPIGGQGMNTGIQDAFNLGWKLAGAATGRYRHDILDTYTAERHPVAESLIAGTDRSYRGILHPSELQQRLVRMFGPFVMRSGGVQRFVGTTLEELAIEYSASPLNLDLGGTSGPKPGQRARIDPPAVRLSDAATITLADIYRQAEWTLLAFEGIGEAADPDAAASLPDWSVDYHTVRLYVTARTGATPVHGYDVLIDAEEHVHAAYGVTKPAFCLIRPDGYIAMRGPLAEASRVAEYLTATVGMRVDPVHAPA